MGMLRARASALVTVAVVVALAGCSGDDGTDVPAFTPSSSSDEEASAPSEETGAGPEASVTETPAPAVTLGDPSLGIEAVVESVPVVTGPQQEVVDAALAYWEVRTAAYATATVDAFALGTVASGDAYTLVTGYVAQLQTLGQRSSGRLGISLLEPQVTGTTATVDGCYDDQGYAVDASGAQVAPPAGRVPLVLGLERGPAGWVVGSVTPGQACG